MAWFKGTEANIPGAIGDLAGPYLVAPILAGVATTGWRAFSLGCATGLCTLAGFYLVNGVVWGMVNAFTIGYMAMWFVCGSLACGLVAFISARSSDGWSRVALWGLVSATTAVINLLYVFTVGYVEIYWNVFTVTLLVAAVVSLAVAGCALLARGRRQAKQGRPRIGA